MTRISKKWAIVLTVGIVAIGGVAFAFWTTAGSGTGGATTGTSASVVVNQTSVVSGLAPGLPAQSLNGNFDNPNGGPIFVANVTATVTGTDKAGCGPSDYTIAGTATVNAEIAPGNNVGTWSGLTLQFNNKPLVNQDVCKNAAVVIALTANAS